MAHGCVDARDQKVAELPSVEVDRQINAYAVSQLNDRHRDWRCSVDSHWQKLGRAEAWLLRRRSQFLFPLIERGDGNGFDAAKLRDGQGRLFAANDSVIPKLQANGIRRTGHN